MRVFVVLAYLMSTAASSALAQSVTVSGGVATGFIDDRLGSAVEAGIDIVGEEVALAFGGRVIMKTDGEIREQDWDEPSEWATFLRYFKYQRSAFEDEAQATVVAGELSGVTVGFGALVDDYSSGIDFDHRHLGVQGRLFATDAGATLMIDDVVSPRILASRGYYRIVDRLYGIAAVAADLSAPEQATTEALVGGSAGLSYVARRHGRPWWLEGYAAVAGWARLGGGGHLGGRAFASKGRWLLRADGQLILASARYLPGYVSSLYERLRYSFDASGSQLDKVRAGGLGGLGARAVFHAERLGLGAAELHLGHKAGLGPHLAGRVAAAEKQSLQLGLAGSYQRLGAASAAWVAATEVRVRLPARLYASGQVARMYRRTTMSVEPGWSAWIALGGVVGE